MSVSIRDAYGRALAEYGDRPDVVVLDADVAGSTKSCVFADKFPERHFNVGVAEQNMLGMAAGFASTGKIPFVNTFAVFLTSIGFLAARTLGSYSGLNMKLMGAYGGMSDAFDGPTHHALEDIAIMRTLPGFQVYVASDATQTDWIVKHCIEEAGPVYVRLSREAFPVLYQENTVFEKGKGMIVKEGSVATVIACGLMVGHALEAAKILEKEGVSLRVVDMFCIKPIDQELILRCARETDVIVTAEEHSVTGGLGGAVAEVLSAGGCNVVQGFVGMEDTHGECGPYAALQEKYGLTPGKIAETVRECIRRKPE